MNLGKGFEPGKYGDLTHAEVAYIIRLSSMLCPIEEIQQRFRDFTNNLKTLRGETVLNIQADYSSRIQREAEMYLKNIEGSPLSHPRLVLDMYMEIYRDARTPRPKQTFRLGPEDWQVSEEPDNRTALNAVDSGTKYLRENEKLTLEKLKRNQALIPTEAIETSEEFQEKVEEEINWKME